MKNTHKILAMAGVVVFLALLSTNLVSAQTPAGKLVVSGDMALFAGPGKPDNCTLRNRFKRGDPAGFRISVIDGATGLPESSAQVVVHVTYGGKTVDVPARYRGGADQPETRQSQWTAKWMVPMDAPTGIVRYSVTAKDKHGRSTEWKPFDIDPSLLTIVE